MWRDKVVKTTTCPVLTLTAEVRELMELFDETHELDPMTGLWRRHSFPGPGGLHEQDPWMMQRIQFLRDVETELLQAPKRPAKGSGKTKGRKGARHE